MYHVNTSGLLAASSVTSYHLDKKDNGGPFLVILSISSSEHRTRIFSPSDPKLLYGWWGVTPFNFDQKLETYFNVVDPERKTRIEKDKIC